MNQTSLDRAYDWYVDRWLWDEWGYSGAWGRRLPEMILYYSVAGAAVLNDRAAESIVRRARKGQPLPARRRRTLEGALKLADTICRERETNPVDWFTGGNGNVLAGWQSLDAVYNIGPKIASFILRDLSFMRDYSTGDGHPSVRYRRTLDRHWYDVLPHELQALFIPIDVYVHSGARKVGAGPSFKAYSANTIQTDIDLYRRAAREVVRWARARKLDPRDVDVYWYGLGSGSIRGDGHRVRE